MSGDISDKASDLEEMVRELSIREARTHIFPDTTYHTKCAWCGEPTDDGRKYCSYGQESCATDANRRDEVLKRTVHL